MSQYFQKRDAMLQHFHNTFIINLKWQVVIDGYW